MISIWLLLLCNIFLVAGLFAVHRQLQDLRATAPAAYSQQESVWIEEPTSKAGTIRMRVAAPDQTTFVLKNGKPVATVFAGTATDIALKTDSTAPAVWDLAEAPEIIDQRWTLADPDPKDLRQANKKGVALTFDGGSNMNALPDILRTLQQHNVQATFFLTGQFVARFPDRTRQILQMGHEIGNHTWDHPHLTTFDTNFRHDTGKKVNKTWFQNQLLQTTHVFSRVTGEMMAPYWRAPFGETNAELNSWAAELGFQHIGWTAKGGRSRTMDTLDWVYDPQDPLYVPGKQMAKQVVSLAKKPGFTGGIVLMHVGVQRRSEQVHKELPAIISGIRGAEIPLQTISALTAP